MDSLIVNKRSYCNIETKSVDETKREITVIGSSLEVDRDNDLVDIKTMRLDNFKKNPVVLWAHKQSEFPIAKAVNIQKVNSNNQLKFKVQFPKEGISQDSDKVYNLIKEGFINATSIGFAIDRKNATQAEDREYGYNFSNTELLELSFVPVPANASALVVQRSFVKAFEENKIDEEDYTFLKGYFKSEDKKDEKEDDKKEETNPDSDSEQIINDFQTALDTIQLSIDNLTLIVKNNSNKSMYEDVLNIDSLVRLDSDESQNLKDKKSKSTGLEDLYNYIKTKKSN